MGVIQRLRNKDANQRVAANRVLEVGCSKAELASSVQGLFDTWNDASDAEYEASLATMGRLSKWAASGRSPKTRHYFLSQQSGYLLVTFGVSAKWIIERGLSAHGQGWVGRIAPVEGSDGGATQIGVSLVRWSTDDSGRIWNGGSYIQLLDGLVAGLDGKYVSEPVNEQDHHFVRRA